MTVNIAELNPDLNESDLALVKARYKNRWMRVVRPMEGDFIRRKDDTTSRVAAAYTDGVRVQPSNRIIGIYLDENGSGSYSGGLDSAVNVELTDEVKTGRFWIFHNDFAMKDNGIDVWIPVRVWQEV